jgi:tripartite-type tricarboxylate transporter receptor subunit TctC
VRHPRRASICLKRALKERVIERLRGIKMHGIKASRRDLAKLAAAAGALLIAGRAGGAHAETIEQFYKGRQMSLIVFSGPGSTYDFYARLLARHLGDHIPGKPSIIVQNLLGAGGLKTVDYLVKIAPRDGSVIGTIGRGLPFEPMLGKNEVRFDPLALTWLGSMNREVTLAMSWHTSKVKTFDDLKTTELLVPGTGAGADSEIIPLAINNLAGTKFKIIQGYRDTSEGALAMERGELDGLAYWSWSAIMAAHPDWLRDKKVNLLFHTGVEPIPGAPQVPSIRDLVQDPIDHKAIELLLAREVLGRPFVAPPMLPPDRTAALRTAFEETLGDPEFRQDAEHARLDTDLVTAKEADAILRKAAAAPPEVIERLKRALDRK